MEQTAIKHGLPGPKKRAKYGNHKVVVDGIKFDSKKEAARYQELLTLENTGVISRLERQYVYELVEAVVIDGRKSPAIRYVCDFRYMENGRMVTEDVKSPATRKDRVYRIKRHLLAVKYGITIKEV